MISYWCDVKMVNVKENMLKKNQNLSPYACSDEKAISFEKEDSFKTPFFHDISKIITTLAFMRYSHKTQVFSLQTNDHLTRRMQHVLYVSNIARTISRALNLNEDLVEAACLGHDLGHTPFGHVGEAILNEISLNNNEGYFKHNIESVRILITLENGGKGQNVTMQTLDAIMCHNGENLQAYYEPVAKTSKEFWSEYQEAYHQNNELKPMTLEGCVVKISDLIAYLYKDIEDAILLKMLKKEDIPKNIQNILGTNADEIINTIILDIVKNSYNKNYIKISNNIYQAMQELKEFNEKNIYAKANDQNNLNYFKTVLNSLFKEYLEELKKNELDENFKNYLENMDKEYYLNNSKERIVIDYIAGMTDNFCINEYNKYLKKLHTKKEV